MYTAINVIVFALLVVSALSSAYSHNLSATLGWLCAALWFFIANFK